MSLIGLSILTGVAPATGGRIMRDAPCPNLHVGDERLRQNTLGAMSARLIGWLTTL
jgi:hypothetical protein